MNPLPPPTPPHITLSIEELQQELAASQEENRKLRAAVNRWQMLVQSALGNVAKVAGELQEYLKSGVLPE